MKQALSHPFAATSLLQGAHKNEGKLSKKDNSRFAELVAVLGLELGTGHGAGQSLAVRGNDEFGE